MSSRRGGTSKTTVGGHILARGNPLASKIMSTMAKRGREEHKIIPPIHDSQNISQSYNQT
jgi:hypothetical protein